MEKNKLIYEEVGKKTSFLFPSYNILGIRVDAISFSEAINQVIQWAISKESRYVCFVNVHMIIEAYKDIYLRKIVNQADMNAPDGMPLVWLLRKANFKNQDRICGPDFMISLCEILAEKKIPIGFYGSTPETLKQLQKNIQEKFPSIKIVYSYSPPFRELTPEEDKKIINEINNSGAKILFVGLGCPKQEKWMAKHKGKIKATMLGVGAAFDFHAGTKKRAPLWMQKSGLEWFYRFLQEPRRMWKRYLVTNSLFVWYMIKEKLRNN